jgi:hypothetical protein
MTTKTPIALSDNVRPEILAGRLTMPVRTPYASSNSPGSPTGAIPRPSLWRSSAAIFCPCWIASQRELDRVRLPAL